MLKDSYITNDLCSKLVILSGADMDFSPPSFGFQSSPNIKNLFFFFEIHRSLSNYWLMLEKQHVKEEELAGENCATFLRFKHTL